MCSRLILYDFFSFEIKNEEHIRFSRIQISNLVNAFVDQNVISGWNKSNVNNILLLELASALSPCAVVTSLRFFKCPLLQF